MTVNDYTQEDWKHSWITSTERCNACNAWLPDPERNGNPRLYCDNKCRMQWRRYGPTRNPAFLSEGNQLLMHKFKNEVEARPVEYWITESSGAMYIALMNLVRRAGMSNEEAVVLMRTQLDQLLNET